MRTRYPFGGGGVVIKKLKNLPWLVWLSGLNAGL